MYIDETSWKALQKLLPLKNRINSIKSPEETYVEMNNMSIHLDVYEQGANTSIIILHGVGGNGRLLSFMAIPLAKACYNVICPDLPGYGYTKYNKNTTYNDWIEIGSKIVAHERLMDRNVFIIGLSAGGMLAYNVACKHQDINGLIFTNILDNRDEEVRLYSAKNKFQAKYGIKYLSRLPHIIRNIKVPIKMVTNMNGLVNTPEILKVLLKDKVGAGSRVQLSFLLSMMNSTPVLEPEHFNTVPVLMVHPENDLWTPVKISDRFFDKLVTSKHRVLLENAGHFPIEEPGLSQMEKEIIDFIKRFE